MSAARKIKGLQVQKENELASFEILFKFMQEYDDQTPSAAIRIRLENLDKLHDGLKSIFMDLQINDEDPENAALYLKEKIAYEKRYYKIKEFLVNKLDQDPQHLERSIRQNDSLVAQQPAPKVQLPRITLPRFSGNIHEWLAFRDLYVALIHSSADLPTIEKLHYLRSQLDGEALEVIRSLPLTQENYVVAWDLLTERYSNKKQIKRKLVQALFDLPTLERENAEELRDLTGNFEKAMKTIDQVSQDADYKHLLLIHLLSSRLDTSTRRSWEEESSKRNTDTITELLEFLRRRVQMLDALPLETNICIRRNDESRLVSMSALRVTEPKCFLCRGNHLLRWCSTFAGLCSTEKEEEIRRHGLCRNCLGKGHTYRNCPSQFSCRTCGLRHHTLLCIENAGNMQSAVISTEARSQGIEEQVNEANDDRDVAPVVANVTTAGTNSEQRKGQVLLITAVVNVVDNNGKCHQARALLDSCSQACFISEKLFQKMNLKHDSIHQEIVGIAGGTTMVKKRVNAVIKSRTSSFYAPLDFFVMPKITMKLPSEPIDTRNWNIPTDIQLADPGFWKPKRVDMVLGAELFFDLFHPRGRIPLGHGLPTLVNSELGWVVSGRIPRGHFITPTDWTIATGQRKADDHRGSLLSLISSSSDSDEDYTSC